MEKMYYMVSSLKLLGIYLKKLTEETIISDKMQKISDDNLHGSYHRVKKNWVSGEHCRKDMQLHVVLEECIGSVQVKDPALYNHYLWWKMCDKGKP